MGTLHQLPLSGYDPSEIPERLLYAEFLGIVKDHMDLNLPPYSTHILGKTLYVLHDPLVEIIGLSLRNHLVGDELLTPEKELAAEKEIEIQAYRSAGIPIIDLAYPHLLCETKPSDNINVSQSEEYATSLDFVDDIVQSSWEFLESQLANPLMAQMYQGNTVVGIKLKNGTQKFFSFGNLGDHFTKSGTYCEKKEEDRE